MLACGPPGGWTVMRPYKERGWHEGVYITHWSRAWWKTWIEFIHEIPVHRDLLSGVITHSCSLRIRIIPGTRLGALFVAVTSVMLSTKRNLSWFASEALWTRRIVKISSGLGKGTLRRPWLMEWIWVLLKQMVQEHLFGRSSGWKSRGMFCGVSSPAAVLFSSWSRVHIWEPLEN